MGESEGVSAGESRGPAKGLGWLCGEDREHASVPGAGDEGRGGDRRPERRVCGAQVTGGPVHGAEGFGVSPARRGDRQRVFRRAAAGTLTRRLAQPARGQGGGHQRPDLGDLGVRVGGVASASFASVTGKEPGAARPSGARAPRGLCFSVAGGGGHGGGRRPRGPWTCFPVAACEGCRGAER